MTISSDLLFSQGGSANVNPPCIFVVTLLLSYHPGSTAYTVNGTTELGEVRYRAFGAARFTSGTTPTSYRYTWQREESGLGLYYYGARWYDPALGRFVQADTIIPNPADAKAFDRYAYALNNPVRYNDPSGHYPCAAGACIGPSELTQAVQAAQDAARSAGPLAGPVAAVGGAALVGYVGGSYAIQWALEDPLPAVPPLHPDLAPGKGNLSITIPVPGSTTVTSGVTPIPGLETTDPGFTAVNQPGLTIVDPLPQAPGAADSFMNSTGYSDFRGNLQALRRLTNKEVRKHGLHGIKQEWDLPADAELYVDETTGTIYYKVNERNAPYQELTEVPELKQEK